MLRVEGLHAGYGKASVLHGVGLHVQPGETVALIGANGAGKTTLLHTLSGLIRPTAGRILFAGAPIHAEAPHDIVACGLIHCPEGRRVFARMTVAENLALGAHLRRDRDGVAGDVARIYGVFPGLRTRRQQLAGTLSGGEQQMLAIGRAMMARPRLLLLDEPSLGLAPQLVQQVFAAIPTLGDEAMALLVVEQNADVALRVAQRAYVLEAGHIILVGEAARLRGDPRIRQAYLGGAPAKEA